MGDLDVLVPFDQREEALALAQQQGYEFTSHDNHSFLSSADPLQRMISHHYHLVGAGNIVLEIHYQLAKTIASAQDSEWFWTMSQPIEQGRILRPEAHFLYLCAHAMAQHGGRNIALQRFYDLHLLATASSLDWQLIIDKAADLRWTYPVERALELAIAYFGTPVSARVLEALRAARPQDEDVRVVADLQQAGSRWAQSRRKLRMLDFPTQLRYFRVALLPSPAYMRNRYQVQPNALVWPYYLYRWFDQGRDIAAWLWRRMRRQ